MKTISQVLYQGPSITESSKALILLHGRAGTAQSMLNLANKLCDNQFYIAAPQAVNGTWYPYRFMTEEKLNEPHLSSSIQSIKDLIDETAMYIPNDQIYVIGFSQGACLALEISTRFAKKYGGIVAFTGGLIGHELDEKKYQGDFKETNVFISNGDQDPYIPRIRSEQSKKVMEKLGARVTLKVYKNRPHIISEDEIFSVRENILSII